ncbi:MAG TPA: leucine-rich repeat domain-containing protein [Acidobacteriota bacterium]
MSGLSKLERLDAYLIRPADFAPLANLKNLSILYLFGTGITDLRVLAGLTKMQQLFLFNNPGITDLSPLSGMTLLTDLSLANCSIFDIRPLVANSGLGLGDVIDLKNNSLTAANCSDLKTLVSRGATVFFTPQRTGVLTCP